MGNELQVVGNELQVFNFNGQDTRVVMVDGEPWWVAKDVCDVLEIQNASRAINEQVEEDEVRKTYVIDAVGREQETYIISESGLYMLIMRSNKPQAKKFRKWVTSEVIPAVRKHGMYMTQQKMTKTIN